MYNNYGYNPYYPQQRYQGVDTNNQQPMMTTYQQPIQLTKPNYLLGKSVDNIDVVKATDIPLDGSISYFPLTDNSAIITKQLLDNGSSKITIFKPVKEQNEDVTYITRKDLEKALNDIDLSELDDIKQDIKEIKKQLKEFKSKKSKDDE